MNAHASPSAEPPHTRALTPEAVPAVRVRGVHKSYKTAQGPLKVLADVSFDLAPGACVALTGESGSGKSTLLHLIAGLDGFEDGEIEVGGMALSAMDDAARAALRRSAVGVVFQGFNLIPSLRVGDNLSFQARLAGRFDASGVADLARRLGLGDLLGRYPEQLSGGQQQRVAIGRALAARPALVLADEPTGNLDETTADEVVALMTDLVRGAGASLLLVTHSERIARRLDRRIRIVRGRIEPEG